MTVNFVKYLPTEIWATDIDIRTKESTYLANEAAIPAYTPMKRDSNHKLIPATVVTDTVMGLSMPKFGGNLSLPGISPIPITGTDFIWGVYTFASIYLDRVNFSFISGVTDITDPAQILLIDTMFDRTGISAVAMNPGAL